MNDDRRNYGIDLLKVFMMFLIVCGHVIWHGNIWSKTVSYNQFVVTGEIVRIIGYYIFMCSKLLRNDYRVFAI